jgi:iron complex outermembrane receptor protein
MIRFWGGATGYKHAELGLADPNDLARTAFARSSPTRSRKAAGDAMPFNLRFAEMTTAIGVQGGHQDLTAEPR